MASLKKTYDAVVSGQSDQNLRLAEVRRVLLALGFQERTSGGHLVLWHDDIEEIVNLQPLSGGKAKAYQVKQVRQLLTKYQFAFEKE